MSHGATAGGAADGGPKVWHVVAFRTRPGVTPEAVEEVRGLFEACVGRSDGLEWVQWGANTSTSRYARGWTEGFVMQFRDRAARDAYLDDPDHRRAGEAARARLYDDLVVFDLDAGGGTPAPAGAAAAPLREGVGP